MRFAIWWISDVAMSFTFVPLAVNHDILLRGYYLFSSCLHFTLLTYLYSAECMFEHFTLMSVNGFDFCSLPPEGALFYYDCNVSIIMFYVYCC
jgi:hypothetical protein